MDSSQSDSVTVVKADIFDHYLKHFDVDGYADSHPNQ